MIYSSQMFFEVRIIKEDVKSLEEIIADIPGDFSAKEKARMAYIELGKNSFFNTKYKNVFGAEQIDIFNETSAFRRPNVGVCKKFVGQYMYILNKLGVRCIEVRDPADEFGMYHTEVTFFDDDEKPHKTNLAVDLSRIQSRSKTNHFAVDTIGEEELREIDTKIGYITKQKGYIDDYFPEIREMFSSYDMTESERVDMMFKVIPKFFDYKKMGDDEQVKSFNFFLKNVFGCQNSHIYRCYSQELGDEQYYMKTFNEAKFGKPPHTSYKIYDKKTRKYLDTDYARLEEIGLIKSTQKYY